VSPEEPLHVRFGRRLAANQVYARMNTRTLQDRESGTLRVCCVTEHPVASSVATCASARMGVAGP
jgi:hypothetical protein